MKMSHAARSLFTSSQLSTPVTISSSAPPSAVTVMSIWVHDDVDHNPHTPTNTTARIFSPDFSRPIDFSSRAANADASGVLTISGRFSFITIHGITASETSPGTIAASSQLAQLTGYPKLPAILAAIGFDACPV